MNQGPILVIGAATLAGRPVAKKLRAAGHTVRILARAPERLREAFPPPFEVVRGDPADPDSLPAALEGCAAAYVGVRADINDAARAEREGAANVAGAAAAAGLARLVYVSGATVFPENAWFPVTKAKLDAEDAIRAAGVPFTILCPTWFMETLPGFVHDGRALVMGTFRHPWHWVAANDFARMVVASYATPAAAGKRLFIHGPEAYTLPGALARYARIAQPGTIVSTIPLWKVRLIAALTRRPQTKAILPFMRYIARVPEGGDPAEANELLGAPTTTLDAWAAARAAPREAS